jgi:hypothetical protein
MIGAGVLNAALLGTTLMSDINYSILIIGTVAYRISCIAAGLIIVILGYRLFRTGIYEKAGDLRAVWGNKYLTLKSAAPGTIFALFGAGVMIMTLVKGLKFDAGMVQHSVPNTGLQASKLIQQDHDHPVGQSPTRPDTTNEAYIRVDSTPPSVPVSLTAHVLPHRVALAWNRAASNAGQVGYYIYRDGSLIGASLNTFFVDWQVSPHTRYNYNVAVFNNTGDVSARSVPAIVTTN